MPEGTDGMAFSSLSLNPSPTGDQRCFQLLLPLYSFRTSFIVLNNSVAP
jgi:hypothetical protein